ncbi:Pollen-specific LRR extensin-like protein [Quillaja saponaria]|uniref:Pollen-specific LRR extensin-like protein n=1 Tax=Quillaja saponaria TaxID=32244 RepID=A0AAD7VIX9_QUISA|nr:Pollen-specific LRR extensin-like protein [Quillaja saponaria]
MDSESSSGGTSSPSGKRGRDPEDEVYLDNLHSHKRYLSEIMASSLNGLTVGDSLSDNLMESPARDEMPSQYLPMSEDSDDSRFCEISINTPDNVPSSPVSPCRYQRPHCALYSGPSTNSNPSHGSNVSTVTSPQLRQRGSESESRFPSSPSDICHSADLRRAALLRSVQMRTQPPGSSSFELPFSSGQESLPRVDVEERPTCSCMKTLVDDREYQTEECASRGISDPEFNQEKSCRVLNMDVKEDSGG